MPAAGQMRATLAGEPASSFNRSDEEAEMANRIWRFVTSGRTKDWFMDVAAELHRTRLTHGTGTVPGVERYYAWLHGTTFRSSSVRYAAVAADVEADLATVPDTFVAICKVVAVDHERVVAARTLAGPGTAAAGEVAARLAENQDQIDWFTRSLRYRYDAYNYALDHLLVETPDRSAKGVNRELGALGEEVLAAERGDFCPPGALPRAGNPDPQPVIPSRYALPQTISGPNAGS